MHPNSHIAYRADIDGLRAIAVLAVLIFHAFPALLPGGFIGVDIFFVISGYLISSIVMKSAEDGRFSIADFYARRIRRIVPPLLAMIVTSLVLGWSILLPDEYAQLAKHALAGIGFISNIVLWQESGYFDSAAHLKPFLHLWSLGVEEQFYIFWPLILILVIRRGLPFLGVALFILAGSFAINIALTSTAGTAGYFLLPGRAWEMLAGAILAWRLRHHGPLFAAGSRIANAVGLLGLLLIALGLWLIDKDKAFPGWWAILGRALPDQHPHTGPKADGRHWSDQLPTLSLALAVTLVCPDPPWRSGSGASSGRAARAFRGLGNPELPVDREAGTTQERPAFGAGNPRSDPAGGGRCRQYPCARWTGLSP